MKLVPHSTMWRIARPRYGCLRPFANTCNLRREIHHLVRSYRNERSGQITIVAKNPFNTTKDSVLESLRTRFLAATPSTTHSPDTVDTRPRSNRSHAIIILASPTFIHWLDDDVHFIPKILELAKKSLYSSQESATLNLEPSFEIDVVAACVDGLAPRYEDFEAARGTPAAEGFSILHAQSDDITPGLWETSSDADSTKSSQPASLTFVTKPEDHSYVERSITLPLANTLFRNGKTSTLVVTRWEIKDSSFHRVRREERTSQTITAVQTPTRFHIPAIGLTPFRQVSSGLGNIVRQIEYHNGSGPASRELEANIDSYLEQNEAPKSTVQVWALVIRPATQIKMPEASLSESVWEPNTNNHLSRTKISRQIIDGASFPRVLSGGGGWGIKQGLLSLDPQTSYAPKSELYSGEGNMSFQEQQASALGRLVEPGSSIRFLTVDNSKITRAAGDIEEREHLLEQDQGTFQSSISFGTVPSTIDDIPQQGNETTTTAPLDIVEGHFGAVSESGIYFGQITKPKGADGPISTSTKIDFPYSYVAYNVSQELSSAKKLQPEPETISGL